MLIQLNSSINKNTSDYLPPEFVFPLFGFGGVNPVISQAGPLAQNFLVDNISQKVLTLNPNNTTTIDVFAEFGILPADATFLYIDFRSVAPVPVNVNSVWYANNITYPIPLRFQLQFGTGGPTSQLCQFSMNNTFGAFPFDELKLSGLVVPDNEQGQLTIVVGTKNS